MSRQLLCCGDSTDLNTASNTPYYILQSGLRNGVLDGSLSLQPSRLMRKRFFWNLYRMLISGKPGGFQYSSIFTRALFAQAGLVESQPLSLLSHFPLLPSFPWPSHWRVDFYIDATTRQVFDDYGTGNRLSDHYRDEVLKRETLAFQHANSVICMAQWTANSVVSDYKIDPAKVHVVPGGANLDEVILQTIPAALPPLEPSSEHPLKLGFLGKDWERKGGPFLMEIAQALHVRGIPTVIRAIGPDTSQLPVDPMLQPLGFIDKQTEMYRFVSELRSWNFGMLFSTAEAAPRSNLECLRLGVPVLSHDIGGISSTLPDDGCGHLFKLNPTAEDVANWIAARLNTYQCYLQWRAKLALRWEEFTWDVAMEQLSAILNV